MKNHIFCSITLQNMIFFLTIANHLNMRKAADELFVSQPLLSQRISAMEQELNVLLFLRTKNGLKLTEAGKTFRQYCEELVPQINAAVNKTISLEQNQKKELSLGLYYGLWIAQQYQLSHKIQQTFPDVVLEVHSTTINNCSRRVLDHSLTFALVPNYSNYELNPALCIRKIGEWPLSLLCSKSLVFSKKDRIYWKDLSDVSIIIPTDQNYYYYTEYIKNKMHENNLAFNFKEFEDLDTSLLHMLLGDGIALGVFPQKNDPDLCVRRISDSSLEVLLIWRSDTSKDELDPVIDPLCNIISSYLDEVFSFEDRPLYENGYPFE